MSRHRPGRLCCCSVPASTFAQHGSVYLHNPYEDVSEGEDETSHTGALNGLGSRLNGGTPVQVIPVEWGFMMLSFLAFTASQHSQRNCFASSLQPVSLSTSRSFAAALCTGRCSCPIRLPNNIPDGTTLPLGQLQQMTS